MDDIEYQRQIIDTFINAIYVYDDKLVFTYNFKGGTEAIPLKAVEDAFGSDLTQVAPPQEKPLILLESWVLFFFTGNCKKKSRCDKIEDENITA